MAHLHPAVHAQATTLIQKEEAYVEKHAGAVDRLLASKEYKLGTLTYSETGQIPQDKFWSHLLKQEQAHPTSFNLHHPEYVGFFTPPARLGELPSGNVIFDVMRERDQDQHAIFAAHHPFYVSMVDHDLALESLSTGTPATGTTTGNPSGTTGTSTGTGSGTTIGTGSGTSTGGTGLDAPGGTVPEPASALLVAAGLVAAIVSRRLARKKLA